MFKKTLLKRIGIKHPIIQAPMGGGPSTPELVAAVSNAGGLGTLAGGYLTPQHIIDDAARVRELTDKPFEINLFSGVRNVVPEVDPAPMLDLLREVHDHLGLPPPTLPPVIPSDPFRDQFLAVLDARPHVFSFTFGIPNQQTFACLRAHGIATVGTATTAGEARLLAEAGVDAIVAQGSEAGAHRGTFADTFDAAMIPTKLLVRQISAAVHVPVIASGGLMEGREIAAVLRSGAIAVQLGTAFVACPESGAAPAYKTAILSAREDRTVITRAFSGRPARGIANDFVELLAGKDEIILPYPLQNALTRVMRNAAAKRGDANFLSLWAGTGVARARALPAGELVQVLSEEIAFAA
jgi:nitronate monooxygenase